MDAVTAHAIDLCRVAVGAVAPLPFRPRRTPRNDSRRNPASCCGATDCAAPSSSEACEQLTRSGKAVHHTTVYRTLEALTAVGLTHAVHGPGATRYGITGEPHHHTVCQQCGHVAVLASEHLAEAVGRIGELTGLRPDSSGSLLVFGRCSGCSG
ncbi:Fur family transcriptional regulator [Streptomyces sp. NPDC059474]|uniref:Fur family transcriptional regulator n=1 Tax=unclassified Streptomyces TaxID=2593676 RepID=UPI0033FD5926